MCESPESWVAVGMEPSFPWKRAALIPASLGREMLQATCRRTLEVTRTSLLFLSSSLGPER